MIVENITKDTSIENIEMADSFFAKMKGLMLKEKGRVLLKFHREGKYQIWMALMRFSIDIIGIGKERRVVDIMKAVPLSFNPKTWKLYTPEKCRYILEIEDGLAQKKGWSVGDSLSFAQE
ncbi:MAG: DUF192 domain-containing protein [Euryarchaeota archaeon]|nr:DUF192 domain-containing protein [Euryarchaeota archaeon]